MFKRAAILFLVAVCLSPLSPVPAAQTGAQYGPGVSDGEIRLGQTMPYSGPASNLAIQGRMDQAFFEALNAKGGINGRKVSLLSLDDGYAPPRAVEQTRKLIEGEQVLALFHSLGTATNSATYRYVNKQKVPHLFIVSGADKFRDPELAPWTTAMVPSLSSEGRTHARHVLATRPDAKIGVLYQNDDFGRDMLKGFREGLGDAAARMLVSTLSYEVTDPTVDSQVVSFKGSGVDTVMLFGIPRFAAQALRKIHAMGWAPVRYVAAPSANIATVLRPLGPDIARGVVAVKFLKDPGDPTWDQDAGMKEYQDFLRRYRPDADPADFDNAFAYTADQLMVHVLKRCGNDLTRENLMREALGIKDLTLPLLLPGIRMNTSQTRRTPIDDFQVVRFDGLRWIPLGDITGSR